MDDDGGCGDDGVGGAVAGGGHFTDNSKYLELSF